MSERTPDLASWRLLWVVVGALLVQAGCVRSADSRSTAAQGIAPTPAPVVVTAARVSVRAATRRLSLVGTLFGTEEVTLSSQVEGQIRTVNADLGDRVEAGQVLAEIEKDQLEARLRVAEARLAKAQADEVRGRELAGKRVISPQEYETMKTAAAVAVAERDGLIVLLRFATVRSPLTGSVARRLTSAGEYVRAGTPLFELVADGALKLRGDVPERFSRVLAVGQPVEVTVDAWPDMVFSGRLERVSPASNPENRSISVEALIENENRKLKPGFFASAGIVTQSDDQALLVPEKAVVRFAGVTRLFVVRDGVARQTPVRVGHRDEDGYVEITEGVYPDDVVVTSGFAQLSNGSPVSIQEAGS
jgi:membrane fusion protein (multidrug efflux system)